jgi:hypothetical protein
VRSEHLEIGFDIVYMEADSCDDAGSCWIERMIGVNDWLLEYISFTYYFNRATIFDDVKKLDWNDGISRWSSEELDIWSIFGNWYLNDIIKAFGCIIT